MKKWLPALLLMALVATACAPQSQAPSGEPGSAAPNVTATTQSNAAPAEKGAPAEAAPAKEGEAKADANQPSEPPAETNASQGAPVLEKLKKVNSDLKTASQIPGVGSQVKPIAEAAANAIKIVEDPRAPFDGKMIELEKVNKQIAKAEKSLNNPAATKALQAIQKNIDDVAAQMKASHPAEPTAKADPIKDEKTPAKASAKAPEKAPEKAPAKK